MAKFLFDNADVLRRKLRTLYNLSLSAASAAALISVRQTLELVAQNAFSVASKDPCLFLMAQFQTYAVFSYLLYDNPTIML